MSEKPRRRLPVEARREELLAAGKRIFSERAFDAISTADLARSAGISQGLLYHYFAGKRGFYVAVVRRLADELIAATAVDSSLSAALAWQQAIGGFYDFLADHGTMYRALVRGGIGSDAETSAEIERVRIALAARLYTHLNLTTPTPLQRAKVYGWVGYAEAIGLHEVEHRSLDRADFIGVLLDGLSALLQGELQGEG